MRFANSWQRLRSSLCRQHEPQKSRRPLLVEHLEARTVPTIIWGAAGNRIVADLGGPVITHADVDLVFWGSGWNNAQTLMNNVSDSVGKIMNSSYLSGLSQYRGIGNGQILQTELIISSDPPSSFTDAEIQSMLSANIRSGVLPSPSSDSQIVYMVITQPGSSAQNIGGEHGSAVVNGTRYHYGWSINNGNLDNITDIFSH